MNLLTANKGKYKVVRVIAGDREKKRLSTLGIVPKRLIEKTSKAHFSGPVLIKIFESKIAIGKILANKVIIEGI